MQWKFLDAISGWPRRVAGGLCLVLGALSLLHGRPSHARLTEVLTAARDLPAGTVLHAADLAALRWPVSAVPPGVQTSGRAILTRTTAVPVARGTPITLGQLLEPRLADALAHGYVAATLSLDGTGAQAMLQSGSYVDLYARDDDSLDIVEGKSPSGTGSTGPVASRVEVLSVIAPAAAGSANANPTLVIATSRSIATQLSAHANATFLATLVAPP